MTTLINQPAVIQAAGNKPKWIEEYFGQVNSGTSALSIARMSSPPGWEEPGQTPEFDEYTVVLKGMLIVRTRQRASEVRAGQGILVPRGEWVKYSTPGPDATEYMAVCMPAFSPATVHRDDQAAS